MSILRIETQRPFKPLLAPSRYKGAHGGRGSGKSHFFADLLIERCLQTPTRAVCVREVQQSLKQSVKRLIEDKIITLGVGHYFEVLADRIKGPYGGLIIFTGMQDHTAESIKSLEGYGVAWVEEAQSLSKRSLELLRPTIREPGSELWFSWNPSEPTDPVDALLRSDHRIVDDGRIIVVETNWKDNRWFPEVLREEMRIDLERNPDTFEHIWNGAYRTIAEAIIFRDRVSFEAFEAPEKVDRFFLGADWGFSNDPTVLIRCWIRDERLYIDHEAFGRPELDEIAALFDQVPGARDWPIKADSARPETISYMRRQGFTIDAARKWPGSVEDGVTHLKGFKRIHIHPRCVNMTREARRYAYKIDKRSGDVLPIIVDAENHGWDSVRYSLDGYIHARGGIALWERLAG